MFHYEFVSLGVFGDTIKSMGHGRYGIAHSAHHPIALASGQEQTSDATNIKRISFFMLYPLEPPRWAWLRVQKLVSARPR